MKALLGALVGDAAGATLEFYHGIDGSEIITHEIATNAMHMPGGGAHHVGPGQITDDGELTLACMHALSGQVPAYGYPEREVMHAYAEWYRSYPFDIGRTCSLAFDVIADTFEEDLPIGNVLPVIQHMNRHSQANGALMRATAIAEWCAADPSVPAERAAMYAREDATYSHPHPICQDTNAVYVFALVLLLRGVPPSDALYMITAYLEQAAIHPAVCEWFYADQIDELDATHLAGHVRIAFTMAFYFLRRPFLSYEDAIRMVLMKGGDTDTNACIVGGLVACYQPIPDWMLEPVLTYDSTMVDARQRRPAIYCPRLAFDKRNHDY